MKLPKHAEKTGEPVLITKNGERDLVVMDIETYNRREILLKLREELLAIEEDKMSGKIGCTLDDLDIYLEEIIEEVCVVPYMKHKSHNRQLCWWP